MRTVTLSSSGRLTLPAEVRRDLQLEGDVEMEIEVDQEQDAIVLRPALVMRRGDAWAYTPSHRELLSRAHADSAEGRVLRFATEDDLIETVDQMQRNTADLSDEELAAAIEEAAAEVRKARPDLKPPF